LYHNKACRKTYCNTKCNRLGVRRKKQLAVGGGQLRKAAVRGYVLNPKDEKNF
jgi:hypothetical protein